MRIQTVSTADELFNELRALYDGIAAPELALIKEWILRDARELLARVAATKSSGELPTAQFYEWLLPTIAAAPSGSEVWAISVLPSCEYDGSPEEETFLRLNIEASQRGVSIRRAFVIPETALDTWQSNRGIVAHRDNGSETMQARAITRRHLEDAAPELIRAIGDGLIAFDARVAQLDVIATDGSIRGRVTTSAPEIAQLREVFERLWRCSRPL